MMSKAPQSVPGPSHVAGNTTHRVIPATITATPRIKTEVFSPQPLGEQFEEYLSSDDEDEEEVEIEENKMKVADTLMQILRWVKIKEKSFRPNNTAAPISDERYPPSARIVRKLEKLVIALENVIDVVDDKRRRGFPLYEMRRAQRNKLWRAAAIGPEMMLDFVLDEERSTIPPATSRPSPPTLPVTPPATTMPEIVLDFVLDEERSTLPEPPVTPRPSTPPPPLSVNPPATAWPEIIVDEDEEGSTIPEPPVTVTPRSLSPPPPVTSPRSASSQSAKSSRTPRPILKFNDKSTLKSTSGRKRISKTKRHHRCHICHKTFSSKNARIQHGFTHLNEEEKTMVKQSWRIGCFFCQKRFSHQSDYHRHLVTHTKEKAFRCDQCGKLFAHNFSLTLHKRSHSANPRPFNCTECGKTFTKKACVVAHKKRVHQKLMNVDCPECPKKFSIKWDMTKHLKVVHLQIPHLCPHPHCNKSFIQKGDLRTHVKKFHPS